MLIDKLKKKEVQNWMKAVLAIHQTTKVLRCTVNETFERFISNLPDDEKKHLEIFNQCLKENKVEHFKTQKKGRKVWKCTHHLCRTLMEHLLDNFENGSQKRLWFFDIKAREELIDGSSKCTQTEEPDEKWMLIKLHMFEDGISRSSLNELDLSQIIKLMRSCQLFTKTDGSAPAFEKALISRNMLMHSTDNEVSDYKTKGVFEEMEELVNLFVDESLYQQKYDIVDDLHQLKDKILIEEEDSSKYNKLVDKVLVIKQHALELDISVNQNLEESKTKSRELVQMLNDATTEKAFLNVEKALDSNSKQREEVQKQLNSMKKQYEKLREEDKRQQAELQKLERSVMRTQNSVDEANTRIKTKKNRKKEKKKKNDNKMNFKNEAFQVEKTLEASLKQSEELQKHIKDQRHEAMKEKKGGPKDELKGLETAVAMYNKDS